MDPNASLMEMLKLAQDVEDTSSADVRSLEPDKAIDTAVEVLHAAARLSSLVEALDGWIRSGGCLPEAWARKSAPPTGTCSR